MLKFSRYNKIIGNQNEIPGDTLCYYPLNGDCLDYSGNNQHGTNNGATWVNGRKEGIQSAHFSGIQDVNSCIDIPNQIMAEYSPWTVSLWYYEINNTGYPAPLLFNNGWSNNNGMVSEGSKMSVMIGDVNYIYHATYYSNNIWNHFVTNSEGRLWYNGVESLEYSVGGGGWGIANSKIGTGYDYNCYGNIQDVRIYNRLLTGTEITSLYNE